MQNRKKSWQIAGYSAFALAYLQLNQNAFGQVSYHDIVPDSILDERSEYMAIDFDGNGYVDFGFVNSSFTFYWWSFETYVHREDIIAIAFYSGNSIMGTSLEISLIYYHVTYFYPFALKNAELVSAKADFNDYGLQLMGLLDHSLSETYSNQCFRCDWYGFFVKETIDKYLGVRFRDADSLLHYGWIRCDVIDSGRTLIVKDYAYELQPDFPIAAGSKTSYADVAIKRPLVAEIYSNGNIIYINVTERPTEEFEIHIYGLNGQSLFYENRTETFNAIAVDLPKGIYLVEVVSGSKKVSEKVYVN